MKIFENKIVSGVIASITVTMLIAIATLMFLIWENNKYIQPLKDKSQDIEINKIKETNINVDSVNARIERHVNKDLNKILGEIKITNECLAKTNTKQDEIIKILEKHGVYFDILKDYNKELSKTIKRLEQPYLTCAIDTSKYSINTDIDSLITSILTGFYSKNLIQKKL